MLVGTDLFCSACATVDGLTTAVICHAAEGRHLLAGRGITVAIICVRSTRSGHAGYKPDLRDVSASRATDYAERPHEQEENEELKSTHFASRFRLVPVRVDGLVGWQSTRIADFDQSVGHLSCYSLRVDGASTGLLHGHRGIVRMRERALSHMAGLSQGIL